MTRNDVIGIIVTILVPLLSGIFAIWLFFSIVKGRKEKLRPIAEAFNGEYVTTYLLQTYLVFDYKGTKYEIYYGGKHHRLSIKKNVSLGFEFSIDIKTIATSWISKSRITSGDSTFDDKYDIFTDNAEKMERVISDKDNRRIINEILYHKTGLYVSNNTLCI